MSWLDTLLDRGNEAKRRAEPAPAAVTPAKPRRAPPEIKHPPAVSHLMSEMVNSVALTAHRPLLVYPDSRNFSLCFGMSQTCQSRHMHCSKRLELACACPKVESDNTH